MQMEWNKNITKFFFRYRNSSQILFLLRLESFGYCLGIKAANSNYPCLYCEVSSDKLHLVLAENDIAYRSYEHQDLILKNENFGKKSFIDYGYSKKPLLSDMPHHRFVICELHLFLRVSDVLFDLMIRDVEVS